MDIRDAVSIVIVCKDKVFVIKRQNYLRSFPGYTAFPGGKVDDCDFLFPVKSKFLKLERSHICALIREGLEELRVDLGSDSRILNIQYFATATSPAFNPSRFKTHFYRVDVSEEIVFDFDSGEFLEAGWLRPADVLTEWKDGQRLCVPPVREVFEILNKDIGAIRADFPNRYDENFEVPHVESIHGLWQVMPLSDTVPPADRTNSFILGSSPVVIVDPSPKDEQEIAKFLTTLSKVKIDLIFITHHHPDHHRNLSQILEKLEIPVALSQYTYDRLLNIYGAKYFRDASIQIMSHGDVVTTWLGKKVLCHHIPGHDEGHLGLAPESLEWFIVGDLFQGVGTVVIGDDEGNMAKYFNTLEYVIKLAPHCVIPSHGIALGGTYILETTLAHRKLREEQILEMYSKGLGEEEILKQIYFAIPEKLFKYARLNIKSHLKKLAEEGRIAKIF